MIFTFHAIARFIERFPKQAKRYRILLHNSYETNQKNMIKYFFDIPFRKIKTPRHKIESNNNYYLNDDGVVLVESIDTKNIKTCLLKEHLEPNYNYGHSSYTLRTYNDFCFNVFENNHKIQFLKIIRISSGVIYQAQYAHFKIFVVGDESKQHFRELTLEENNKLNRYLSAIEGPAINQNNIKEAIPYSLEHDGVIYYYNWDKETLNVFKSSGVKKKKYIPVDSIDDESVLLKKLVSLIEKKHENIQSIKEQNWYVNDKGELHFSSNQFIFNISEDLKKRAPNEYKKLLNICYIQGSKTFEELNLSDYLSEYLQKVWILNDILEYRYNKHAFIENLYLLPNNIFLYSEKPLVDFESLLDAKYIRGNNQSILTEIFTIKNILDVPLINIKRLMDTNYLEFFSADGCACIQIEEKGHSWWISGIHHSDQIIIQKADIVKRYEAFIHRAYHSKSKIPYAVLNRHNYIYQYQEECHTVYYKINLLTKQKKILTQDEILKINLLKEQEQVVKNAFLNDRYIITSMTAISSKRIHINAINDNNEAVECELWNNQELRLYESNILLYHEPKEVLTL